MHRHGQEGPAVFVLHGGPGAAGSAGPIARGLADDFRVFEPYQRGSGDGTLSVERHVEDLHGLIGKYCPNGKPLLAGESWGAMLALAYAARYPTSPAGLALIGCGTFDEASRRVFQQTIADRLPPENRDRLRALEQDDSEEALHETFEQIRPVYDVDPLPMDNPMPDFDLSANRETWDDMLRLQSAGVYPAAFADIACPVLMLHGSYDPHPGKMIRDTLRQHIPHIEYTELEDCGHSPWRERHARDRFFEFLRTWLLQTAGA